MKFLSEHPCLVIGKNLIVADLHIGIESRFYKDGIKIPSQTVFILETIIKLMKEHKLGKIIFIGDIKYDVPGTSFQEIREIPEFFNKLMKKYKVEVLAGNHDSDVGNLLKGKIKLKKGLRVGNIYLTHGHKWPGEGFLKCKTIVIGHEHPQIEFRDALGYRFIEQVWVRAKFDKKKIEAHYKTKVKSLPELVIMPAFNHFSGGICLNGKFKDAKRKDGSVGLGPVARSADINNSDIYLVDGTHLGKLKDIK